MRQGGAPHNQRAIALFSEAVELDPRFALAWTDLALSYAGAMVFTPETAELSRKASDEAFERAKACAPDSWSIHAAQAAQHMLKHEWLLAQADYDKVSELAPTKELAATAGLHFFSACLGRSAEAVEYYGIGTRADPLAPQQMFQFVLDCRRPIRGGRKGSQAQLGASGGSRPDGILLAPAFDGARGQPKHQNSVQTLSRTQ